MHELRIKTERRTQLVEITRDVDDALEGVDGASAALIFVPHTTAGLTINEHADPAVARDFETALERIVGDGWGWEHLEDGEENAPSHIRAGLMGRRWSFRSRTAAWRSAPGRGSSSASSTGRGGAAST